MKNVFTALIIIICILSIIVGKVHWNHKIDAAGNSSEKQAAALDEKKQESEKEKIKTLTKHLPDQLTEKILLAKSEGKPLKIVAMGSNSTAEGNGTWTSIFQKRLDKAYGKGVFQVIVESYGSELSINIVQQEIYTSALEHQPDIVLLEPFLINDNGKVAIANTLESVDTIIEKFNETSDEVVIMLQPPNPIHNAIYYPDQVIALKQYAEENNYIYLNHWTNWPDYKSDEFLEYVDDNSLPNAKGHQVWADYIGKYFTGEELE